MNKRLQALLARRTQAVASMKQIHTEAGDASLSAEQQTAFDAAQAEITALDADITRVKAAIEAERGSAVVLPDSARIESGADRREADPRHGFRSLGEFAVVARQCQLSGVQDERLHFGAAAATTYGNEGSLSDGGFMIPPEFSADVWMHSLEEDALLPLCDGMPISGNSMTYPKDETTPWGTDGIRAYWENEAGAATQTKPKGTVNTLRLNKLMALVPVTDELQADASALGAYIGAKAPESIRWKTSLALFDGTGAGQPEGVFQSAARIDVAKEVGQAADTVVAANIAKMYARQIKPGRAVWVVNQMVLPQIMTLALGNNLLWTPPNEGFKSAPNGFLLGRPIVFSQAAKILGDVGDIGMVDFKYVRAITKRGGIETATSMHLWFDQALQAFRFIFRVDAKPIIAAAVSPFNGSDTLSPFVFLADRA